MKNTSSLKLFAIMLAAGASGTTWGQEAESSEAAATTVVGGFVDFQYLWKSATDNKAGFALNDGAIYINHAAGNHALTLDIPFMARDNTAGGSNLELPGTKAQAYIDIGIQQDVRLWAGQFDTPYGFELNDSKDIFFTQPGLIYAKVLPTTHAGLLLNATFGSVAVKALVSNVNNMAYMMQQNPEAGLVLAYSDENSATNGSVGVLVRSQDSVTTILYNGLLSYEMSKGQTFGIEADLKTETDKDAGMAFLGQYSHGLSETLSAAIRAEYLSKIGTNNSDMGLRVGVNQQLSEALKIKADYGMVMSKLTKDSDSDTDHEIGLAAVYAF